MHECGCREKITVTALFHIKKATCSNNTFIQSLRRISDHLEFRLRKALTVAKFTTALRYRMLFALTHSDVIINTTCLYLHICLSSDFNLSQQSHHLIMSLTFIDSCDTFRSNSV